MSEALPRNDENEWLFSKEEGCFILAKKKSVILHVDLNAVLTGFDSARTATPAHHRIMRHYASPLLLGPSPSDDLLELIMHIFTADEADLVQHLPPLRPRSAKKSPLSPVIR